MTFTMELNLEALRLTAEQGEVERMLRRVARIAREGMAARGHELVSGKVVKQRDWSGEWRATYFAEGKPFPPTPGWDSEGRECWEWPS